MATSKWEPPDGVTREHDLNEVQALVKFSPGRCRGEPDTSVCLPVLIMSVKLRDGG